MQFEYRSKSFDIEGVSKEDHIYKYILENGNFYEIDLLNYIYTLKSSICSNKNNNIVFDIGANIGNHAIFLSTFIADHLIAIEPNVTVLPTLRRNLSKNVSNYTLYECAVGEEPGRGRMIVPNNTSDNVGAAQVDMQSEESDVEITTLDALFSAWKETNNTPINVTLLKIDVEGMELKVLKGGVHIINEFRPHIVIEAPNKQDLKNINAFLRPLGYQKLPGRWALTPVYHFAYKPGITLFMQAYYMKTRRSLNRRKQRIKKLFIKDHIR